MQRQSTELKGPPLPSLRLWVSPLQLVSAAIWQTVQQKVVRDYGMLDEFVTMVTNVVPELLSDRLRARLSLGLRAQSVLELCRLSADLTAIQSHLERMQTLTPLLGRETTDAEVGFPLSNFLCLVQTLLNDSEERHHFFQEVFPVKFGPKYDVTIKTLTRMFLLRLEKLLPVPTLQQAVSLLSDGSSVLEECVESMSFSQDLKTLLDYHSDLSQLDNDNKSSPSIGDCILTALDFDPMEGMVAGNEQRPSEIHAFALPLIADSFTMNEVGSVPTKKIEIQMDSELEERETTTERGTKECENDIVLVQIGDGVKEESLEEEVGPVCETVMAIGEDGQVELQDRVSDGSVERGESSVYIDGKTKCTARTCGRISGKRSNLISSMNHKPTVELVRLEPTMTTSTGPARLNRGLKMRTILTNEIKTSKSLSQNPPNPTVELVTPDPTIMTLSAQPETRNERSRKKLNQWSETRMKAAIAQYRELVEAGSVPQVRSLARAWNVPNATLQRRVKGNGDHKHTIGRKPFMSQEDENVLVELVRTHGEREFPLRMKDIQDLAFQFAQKKGIKGFSETKQKAGYAWFQGFLKRNPNLSLRKPECFPLPGQPDSTAQKSDSDISGVIF